MSQTFTLSPIFRADAVAGDNCERCNKTIQEGHGVCFREYDNGDLDHVCVSCRNKLLAGGR